MRPSGTEPKIKIYVEQLFGPDPQWNDGGFVPARAQMDGRVHEATLTFVDALLRLVDIRLPRAALLLSPLVSLDNRIDFARGFLPELEARLREATFADAAALTAWADARLERYGSDPRALVSPGVTAHFATSQVSAEQRRILAQIFS